MTPVYLLLLVALLGCMVLVDRRWRLVFWRDPRRAAIALVAAVALLLVVDLVGIALGVFHRGETWTMTGVLLAPELPLEEPLFLVFLVYLALVLLAAFERLPRRARR